MNSSCDVLAVTADRPVSQALDGLFGRLGMTVEALPATGLAVPRLTDEGLRLLVIDLQTADGGGESLLHEARRLAPSVPVIILTEPGDVHAAVRCMRGGALDCLVKPVDLERLGQLVAGHVIRRVHDTVNIDHPLKVVAGYQLMCEIGGGNMGVVYLATMDDRRCALKVLRPPDGTPDEQDEARARFTREACAAARIDHPHVVHIYDYGIDVDARVPYIAMELLDGVPLFDLVRREPDLDDRQKAAILAQVASALAVIHAQGICHRDIKPANILVDGNHQAKVTDFGVAYTPGSDLTVTGELIGSPAYMAPEAYHSARVDGRADLFSLGVVAYEFLLGEHPFMGPCIADTAIRINHERPTEPRRLRPDFPLALQAIVGRLLRKQPAARYPNAAELEADLRDFAEGTAERRPWFRRLLAGADAWFRRDWA